MSFICNENSKGPRTVSYETGTQSDFTLFTFEAQVRVYPFQWFTTYFIAVHERCIKGHSKIRYEYIHLSFIVQNFSSIVYDRNQLSFTTMSFPKSILPVR